MRKKLLIFLSVFFLAIFFLIFFTSSSTLAACVPDRQSCDVNNTCCNFPDTLCRGGYCEPEHNPTCGRQNTPCCDAPNPRCVPGLSCDGGYCSIPSTPTPTPYCGRQNESCCPTEPKCILPGLVCQNGFCRPPATTLPPPYTPPPTGEPFHPTYCVDKNPDSGIRGPGNICIPTNISDFIGKFLLRWAVGLAGVAALFLIIFAGFQIMTAAGNPEKLQAGRELLTSAIIGLLLVIFSVVLLQVIGIKILEIPGFGNFTR